MRPFNSIQANDAMYSDSDGTDRTDSLFHNMAARVSFDTFLGILPDADQITSVIWVARADLWMPCVIEDLQRRRKGVA